MWQQKRAIWIIWSQYKRNIKGTDDWCLIFNTPVLFLELLVQFELIIYRVHSPSKLLVFPGIGCGDAVCPHSEERDGPCSDSETPSVKQQCAWFMTIMWFYAPSALNGKVCSAPQPFALSGGWASSTDTRGFLLSGSGESGESLITSDSWSSFSNKPFNLREKRQKTEQHERTKFCKHPFNVGKSKQPLRVLPAFVFCFFAAIFLRPVFPVLPLPPPLLSLLFLWRFATAGDDAIQYPLVSVCVSHVGFH